jgi:hypothetical protein
MTQQKQSSMWNTTLSIILILLGFLLLLDTLNIVGDMTAIFLAGIFCIGGLIGVGYYIQDRQRWWALIPGGLLLGLSGFFVIDALPFLNRRVDEVGFMMFAFALAFWVIFLTEQRQKWAIIPAILFSFVATIITVEHPEFFIALVFGLVALFGFRHFIKNPGHWWILIPSSVMLGVFGVLTIDSLGILHGLDEGSFMLFAIATGFWIIFVTQKKHWWAGIPAGILTTIAFMVALGSIVHGINFEGPFIMLGFGLTFAMLWARRANDSTHWAIWPAMILSSISLLILAAEHLALLWPLFIIGLGIWLIGRNIFPATHKAPNITAE